MPVNQPRIQCGLAKHDPPTALEITVRFLAVTAIVAGYALFYLAR